MDPKEEKPEIGCIYTDNDCHNKYVYKDMRVNLLAKVAVRIAAMVNGSVAFVAALLGLI